MRPPGLVGLWRAQGQLRAVLVTGPDGWVQGNAAGTSQGEE